MDFSFLMILSYHNSGGDRIDDTTTAGDTQVLIPLQNGVLPRKQNVSFCAGPSHTLNFVSFIMINPYPVGSVL